MSLGAAVGGRISDRSRHPLRIYAVAEGAIGLYCLSFPLLFPWLGELYLLLVPEIGASSVLARNLVRFALGVFAFLLPTFFMGITTPAFARAVAFERQDRGAWLARLYGWNTLGAALGALVTAYFLVPKLGLVGSMILATAINFGIALAAYRLSTPVPESRPAPEEPREAPPPRHRKETQRSPSMDRNRGPGNARRRRSRLGPPRCRSRGPPRQLLLSQFALARGYARLRARGDLRDPDERRARKRRRVPSRGLRERFSLVRARDSLDPSPRDSSRELGLRLWSHAGVAPARTRVGNAFREATRESTAARSNLDRAFPGPRRPLDRGDSFHLGRGPASVPSSREPGAELRARWRACASSWLFR